VRCLVRIRRLKDTPEPISLAVAAVDPYKLKPFRKVCGRSCTVYAIVLAYQNFIIFFLFVSQVIDNCAFRVYGHWVKKGDCQNRAALFENSPKTELKVLYITNLNRL